jgi:putative SOS response-associated peptidase YedK
MCGRFTYRLTWPEIVRLYRLPLDVHAQHAAALQRLPTDPIDVVVEREGKRDCVSMRWGRRPRSVHFPQARLGDLGQGGDRKRIPRACRMTEVLLGRGLVRACTH